MAGKNKYVLVKIDEEMLVTGPKDITIEPQHLMSADMLRHVVNNIID